ncbi:MAG: hypothetical protein EBS05_23740 [Proteobacteria bacterium]|nr:hypothetical protein [Pseudomonadota bacterium]
MIPFESALTTLLAHYEQQGLTPVEMAKALQVETARLLAAKRPCRICGATLLIGKGHHSKNRQNARSLQRLEHNWRKARTRGIAARSAFEEERQ